ncbi:hypothetical protein G6F56_005346 [Rhizopus delemar]|nr:hypothetical protein G6F56_005346 [Rhizopus delemar]
MNLDTSAVPLVLYSPRMLEKKVDMITWAVLHTMKSLTETEKLNTQETDGPVEEVDKFDFQGEEFRKLIEEYAQNYKSDDDVDSVSANDIEPIEIDDETIVHNVEVRKNKFNKLGKISLHLMKICTEGGVSRACQRKIHFLFNEFKEGQIFSFSVGLTENTFLESNSAQEQFSAALRSPSAHSSTFYAAYRNG